MRLIIALVVVITIYSIQAYLYRRYWDKDLSVSLSFSKQTVEIGEKVELTEVIENHKSLPLPVLHVKFKTARTFAFDNTENAQISDHYYRNDVFSIAGYQRITRTLPFTPAQRGYFPITEVHLISKNLFLTSQFAKVLDNDTALYVLPSTLPLHSFTPMQEQIMGDFISNKQGMEDPFFFRGIRPYQSYDTMKSINWKASAHTGNMMVNQYFPTTSNEVRILLNLTPYKKSNADILYEHGIRIANTIGTSFMEKDIDVSFYTNGVDIVTKDMPVLHAGHGRQHKLSLSKLLSRLDLHQKPSDFLELATSLMKKESHAVSYILISTYRDDAMHSFFNENRMQFDIHWIIPEFDYNEVTITHANMLRWDL